MNTMLEEALGPIRPEVHPWRSNPTNAGALYNFGQVTLTEEAADIINKFKKEAAARNLTIPKAILLVLSYLVAEDHVDQP